MDRPIWNPFAGIKRLKRGGRSKQISAPDKGMWVEAPPDLPRPKRKARKQQRKLKAYQKQELVWKERAARRWMAQTQPSGKDGVELKVLYNGPNQPPSVYWRKEGLNPWRKIR